MEIKLQEWKDSLGFYGERAAIDQLDERWLKLILSGIKAGTDPSIPIIGRNT